MVPFKIRVMFSSKKTGSLPYSAAIFKKFSHIPAENGFNSVILHPIKT